jgi:hypothetical protein
MKVQINKPPREQEIISLQEMEPGVLYEVVSTNHYRSWSVADNMVGCVIFRTGIETNAVVWIPGWVKSDKEKRNLGWDKIEGLYPFNIRLKRFEGTVEITNQHARDVREREP